MVLSGNAREYSATVVTVIGVTEEQAAAPKFMLRLLGDCHGAVYSCCVAETIARALLSEDRSQRQTVLMLGRYILDCEYAMGRPVQEQPSHSISVHTNTWQEYN